MLGKEIPVHTPKWKLLANRYFTGCLHYCGRPVGADDAASGIVDSQTFLKKNLTPAGPPASASAAAVEKLLGQMTLKEKLPNDAAGNRHGHRRMDQSIRINSEKLHKAVAEYGVGSILNVHDQALSVEKVARDYRAIQEEAKKTRLHVPVLYGIDTIHGPNYIAEGTLFPQPLAMAATWNPELMLRGSQIAPRRLVKRVFHGPSRPYSTPGGSRSGLACGRHSVRTLTSQRSWAWLRFAVMKASDLSNPASVSASLKHYMGYSYPTTGGDRSPALIPEKYAARILSPTFAAAVKAGGAHRDGELERSQRNSRPCQRLFAQGHLARRTRLQGFVVSDWMDIKKLVSVHHVAVNEKEATRIAVLAGIDMSMVPSDYSFSNLLLELAQEGKSAREPHRRSSAANSHGEVPTGAF